YTPVFAFAPGGGMSPLVPMTPVPSPRPARPATAGSERESVTPCTPLLEALNPWTPMPCAPWPVTAIPAPELPPTRPSPVAFVTDVTLLELYSPPTSMGSPSNADTERGRPSALTVSATSPPSPPARMARRLRGLDVSISMTRPLCPARKGCRAIAWRPRPLVDPTAAPSLGRRAGCPQGRTDPSQPRTSQATLNAAVEFAVR